METNKLLASRIKSKREELGFTQQDLAKSLGMNKSTIQRYETGNIKKIKLPVVDAIAQILKVNPSWLVGKTNEEKDINYSKIEIYSDKEKQIIKKYRSLDESGKQFVDLTLDREYQRCNHVKVEKLIARGHESDKPIEVEIKSNIKPKPTDEEF